MSDTEGQPASGEHPRAAEAPEVKAPRNDAEAAAQEAAKEAPEVKEEKPAEEPKPKRNRTGEYINRLQSRVKELEGDLQALKARPPEKAPELRIEDFNFDAAAHTRATAEQAAKQAVETYRFQQQQETAQRRIQEVTDDYNVKVTQFTAEHPDFQAKVLSIPYQPSPAVELAIMTHPNGPEIAYALANDDDLAFQLASIQPHLAAAAVDRIASRLTAAPQAPQTIQPVAKPVSQAPPPVPTVKGKSPTETPDEKLTDEEWVKRRRARQRAS